MLNGHQIGKKRVNNLRHHLLENDDFEQSLISAAWFSKNMPKKRMNQFGYGTRTKKNNDIFSALFSDPDVSIGILKHRLEKLERLYSDT